MQVVRQLRSNLQQEEERLRTMEMHLRAKPPAATPPPASPLHAQQQSVLGSSGSVGVSAAAAISALGGAGPKDQTAVSTVSLPYLWFYL